MTGCSPRRATALLVHVPKRACFYPLVGSYRTIEMVPMGLFAVASAAQQRGHQVRMIQLGVEQDVAPGVTLARLVRDSEASTVGLSLHWHQQTADVLAEVAALRRDLPGVRIVLGGFTASFFARELVQHHGVDAVCRGEAEFSFAELLDREVGESLAGVPNCVWRDGDEVVVNEAWHVPDRAELDGYRFFDREVLRHLGPYRLGSGMPPARLHSALWNRLRSRFAPPHSLLFPLMTFRGCPYECAFCAGSCSSQRLLAGRTAFTPRSGEAALQTALDAAAAGFRTLLFEHVNELTTVEQLIVLLEGLAEQGAFESIWVESRDAPGEPFLDALAALVRQGRRVHITLSPDFWGERSRARYKQPAYTDDQLLDALHRSGSRGITADVFCLAGLPDEHERAPALTRQLLAIEGVKTIQVRSAMLEPGAPMFVDPDRYGIAPTVRTLEDYRQAHAHGRFPQPLGFTANGTDPARFDAMTQERICRRYCPLGGRLEQPLGNGLDTGRRAAGRFCRQVLTRRRAPGGTSGD